MNRYKGGYQIFKLKNVYTIGEDGSVNLTSDDLEQFNDLVKKVLNGYELKPIMLNFKLENADEIITTFSVIGTTLFFESDDGYKYIISSFVGTDADFTNKLYKLSIIIDGDNIIESGVITTGELE